MIVIIAALLWLGLFPQQVFNTSRPALRNLRSAVVAAAELKVRAPLGEGDALTGVFSHGGME